MKSYKSYTVTNRVINQIIIIIIIIIIIWAIWSKLTNWSFSLPGFLKIILCEKIFTWGSVEDEHIVYIFFKTLSLIVAFRSYRAHLVEMNGP